jgi:serine/threonine protein kinase
VRYIEHLDWDSRLLIIIMEYVSGGDLGRLIFENGSLIEEAVKTMALQLLDALGYLHENNITHRDVKPDNILVSSRSPFVVKLTDFGLSKMVDNEQTFLRTFCGTLLYCAPEVYTEFAEYDELGNRNPRNRQRRQVRGQRYDHAVDIWSLGGVLFFAMTGKPPYPVKGGISYSELLHRIMTEDLDISPLLQAGISALGIDFIRRMLNRRPENRATVEMLKDHPWLGGTGEAFYRDKTAGESYDEISDDELDQQASQLSLADRGGQRPTDHDVEILEDDEVDYNDENQFGGYESEKENYTFNAGNQQQRQQQQVGGPRLFGEVNLSAIGSSGAIPSNRLNLPVSASGTSFGTTEILGNGDGDEEEVYEIKDSFDSEGTPKQKTNRSQSQSDGGQGLRISILSASKSRSVDHLNNMTFNVESQDLGGTESIMEHLNMRSAAVSHLPSHDSNYFTASKRKTVYEPSEGSDNSAVHDRPAIKRFRSEALLDSMTDYSSGDDDGEYELLAHVPPLVQTRSTRQMDEPVNKSTYWTAGDRKSYHLRYPEMTQLQLDAFTSAAKARGEEFGPGRTPLWDLAMKYFPPAHYEQVVGRLPLDIETVSNASNDVKAARQGAATNDSLPPTVGLEQVADDDYIPDTLPQQPIVVPVPVNPPGKRIVASLHSSPDSGIQDISIHVTESMLSWGRALDNIRIYEPKTQVKVPKYAFKIMLWKPDYDPSRDFRPWNKSSTRDEESFHFYMSTKSNHGIYINDSHLPSNEPKSPNSDSRHWVRLQDGDSIVVCNWFQPSGERTGKTELIFRCAWGGSSVPRDEMPPGAQSIKLVSDHIARELDNFCSRAERRVKANDEHDFKIAEAVIDRDERAQDIRSEKERSHIFEQKRLEARRILAARHSRKGSPASAPPAVAGPFGARLSPGPGITQAGRTVPTLKRGSPAPGGFLQND